MMTEFFALFGERIMPFDEQSARLGCADSARRPSAQAGNIKWADPMIAGTARSHGLTIATRNVDDFELLDVDVVNPWEPS